MKKQVCEQESRRKFLKKAGKFAVYTPPALMLMSKPGSEVFAISHGGGADEEGGPNTSNNACNAGGALLRGAIAKIFGC